MVSRSVPIRDNRICGNNRVERFNVLGAEVNPYSSAAVEIQKERGHKVITTGPYRYVRHPMYVGAILWAASIPLALGSLITFIPVMLLCPLIVARTHLEDRTLKEELEGYTDYAETVRNRLIPGVW